MQKTYSVICRNYRGIWITFSAGFKTIAEAQAAAEYARQHGTQYDVNGRRILFDVAENL